MTDSFVAEQQVKRGPGRPPKIVQMPEEVNEPIVVAEYDGEDVTYVPGADDPTICKWQGREFKANVPMRVRDKGLIESARTNRFFRVGDQGPEPGDNDPPKNATQYRAHVVAWMKEVNTVDDLVVKWSADRDLRRACEVGHDDIDWLGRLFEPKLRHMRIEEQLSELDVAGVFVKHGILEIPWRS
jgi:hypothetical protein